MSLLRRLDVRHATFALVAVLGLIQGLTLARLKAVRAAIGEVASQVLARDAELGAELADVEGRVRALERRSNERTR